MQHEADHLDGKLFIDYLGSLARHSIKDKLREFETQYQQAQSSGEYPQDAEIVRQLDAMTGMPSVPLAEPAAEVAQG